MKILSVNAGSSSLKFTMYEMPEEKEIVSGSFEKIGLEMGIYTIKYNGEKIKKEVCLKTHKECVNMLLKDLVSMGIIKSYADIEGIGHRVVQGGEGYDKSVLIDDEVIKAIESFIPLAPLHNKANLIGIESFSEVLPSVKQVAVFDTAFHQTMNESEYMYPIPLDWYKEHGVRKYGFHGTSHMYVSEYMKEYLGKYSKMINCHIGNGASICAINNGKCVDTTMGFTPLAGLMMGTRSGDVDASIVSFISEKLGLSAMEVVDKLNKESGLMAISGISSDLRDIENEYLNGNERAALALEMYSRRIANYISIYYTLLDGAEVITFTAGVGEKSPIVRSMVLNKLKSLGIKINEEANQEAFGKFGCISGSDSKVEVYVVPTDEEVMISRDTYNLIKE